MVHSAPHSCPRFVFFALDLRPQRLAGCWSHSRQSSNYCWSTIERSPILANQHDPPAPVLPNCPVGGWLREGCLPHMPHVARNPGARGCKPGENPRPGLGGAAAVCSCGLASFNPRPALPSPGHWGALQDRRGSTLGQQTQNHPPNRGFQSNKGRGPCETFTHHYSLWRGAGSCSKLPGTEALTSSARPLHYELGRPQGQDKESHPSPGLIPG